MNIKLIELLMDAFYSILLELLIDAFPKGASLPKSYYEVKKYYSHLITKRSTLVQMIVYYFRVRVVQELYHSCGSSHWATKRKNGNLNTNDDAIDNFNAKGKKPAKLLHYFPLIPRLQRLFVSTKTSNGMR